MPFFLPVLEVGRYAVPVFLHFYILQILQKFYIFIVKIRFIIMPYSTQGKLFALIHFTHNGSLIQGVTH